MPLQMYTKCYRLRRLKSYRSHISAALDLDTLSSNGEGDEGNEGHEGHEGNEEEDCEQDCHWQDGQGHGAPWLQGEDRRWPHLEGPDQEQVRQGCEQEEQPARQGQPLDRCRQEGTRRAEDQGLLRHQEGHAPLRQGKGVLQGLSALGADLRQMTYAGACVRHQLQLWGFPQLLSAGAPSSKQRQC